MARLRIVVAIDAPRDAVFNLVRDQAQRGRFLPDGWRLVRTLTDWTDGLGSQMEIEERIGPRPTLRVLELLVLTRTQIVEGPPIGDNFVTTWTVLERSHGTEVELTLDFEYGGLIGEWLVKRRLHRAFLQMLQRLGRAAIEDAGAI